MAALVLLLAALAGQAGAAAPAGPQWERLEEDEQVVIFIDPARIARAGDVVRIVGRSEPKTEQADGLRALVTYSEIDCARRTRTVHRMEGYRADGTLIRAFDVPPQSRAVRPLSGAAIDVALIERACRREG